MHDGDSDRPYHHGDLRRTLIDTAMTMLVRDGNWNFTLREVARRAGVSHNAPYKHFADRTALLHELAFIGFDRLQQVLQGASCAATGAFPAELEDMARAYLDFGTGNAALYRLMFGPEVATSSELHLQPRAMAPFVLLLDVLQRHCASGKVKDRPVRGLAAACWGQLHGLTMLAIDGLLRPEKVGEDGLDQALATLWDGLRA